MSHISLPIFRWTITVSEFFLIISQISCQFAIQTRGKQKEKLSRKEHSTPCLLKKQTIQVIYKRTKTLTTKPNLKRKALGYFRPACQQLQPQRASKGSDPGYNKPRYKQSNTQQRQRGRCKPSPSTCTRLRSDPERRSAGRARGERGRR